MSAAVDWIESLVRERNELRAEIERLQREVDKLSRGVPATLDEIERVRAENKRLRALIELLAKARGFSPEEIVDYLEGRIDADGNSLFGAGGDAKSVRTGL